MTLESDGRHYRLGLDDLGCGEPALLLLTGWCSSRARWARAARLLADRRRVVSFEWRGHGDSAPADGDFGTQDMVQDALEVISAAGLQSVIPCSASHSGWVAIELRRRLGGRVPAIVHLDWMLTQPPPPYMDLLSQLQTDDGWQAARDTLFKIWRADDQSPEINTAIAVMNEQDGAMWQRSGREIEGSYRRHGSPLQELARLEPPPRVLHIYGQPASPEYLQAQEQFAREHDGFSVRRIDARTHFSMLERPAEVARAIDEFTVTTVPA